MYPGHSCLTVRVSFEAGVKTAKGGEDANKSQAKAPVEGGSQVSVAGCLPSRALGLPWAREEAPQVADSPEKADSGPQRSAFSSNSMAHGFGHEQVTVSQACSISAETKRWSVGCAWTQVGQ